MDSREKQSNDKNDLKTMDELVEDKLLIEDQLEDLDDEKDEEVHNIESNEFSETESFKDIDEPESFENTNSNNPKNQEQQKRIIQIDTDLLKQQTEQLKYNPENQNRVKTYLANNIVVIHTIYLLVFLMTLFNRELGILSLILGIGYIYYQAVLTDGRKSDLNDRVIELTQSASEKTKSGIENLRIKANEEAQARAARQAESGGQENTFEDITHQTSQAQVVEENGEQKIPLTDEQLQQIFAPQKTSSAGAGPILVIICALLALYGVFGSSFFETYYGSSSLNESLSGVSDLLDNANRLTSGIGNYFSSQELSDAGAMISFAKLAVNFIHITVIGVPVLAIIFVLTKNYNMVRLLAIIEVLVLFILGLFISYVVEEVAGTYSSYVYDFSLSTMGFTALIFIIGVLGMTIFSLTLRKPKNTPLMI